MKCKSCRETLSPTDQLKFIEGSLFQTYQCRCKTYLFLWCPEPAEIKEAKSNGVLNAKSKKAD